MLVYQIKHYIYIKKKGIVKNTYLLEKSKALEEQIREFKALEKRKENWLSLDSDFWCEKPSEKPIIFIRLKRNQRFNDKSLTINIYFPFKYHKIN